MVGDTYEDDGSTGRGCKNSLVLMVQMKENK